jgi:hypothetical protein
MEKKKISNKRIVIFVICFLLSFVFIVLSVHFCEFRERAPMTWEEIRNDIGWILLTSLFVAIVCVFKYDDVTNN